VVFGFFKYRDIQAVVWMDWSRITEKPQAGGQVFHARFDARNSHRIRVAVVLSTGPTSISAFTTAVILLISTAAQTIFIPNHMSLKSPLKRKKYF
jgi:hypothetical protein